MMYYEFKNTVAGNIKNFLPQEYAGAEVSLKDVMKNNGKKLTGLLITTEDSRITPNIYLEGYYEQYIAGKPMKDILEDIAERRINCNTAKDLDADINSIIDFEQIKSKITCRLINAGANEEYLSNKPYTQVEDLAAVYAVDLGSCDDGGRMSAAITWEILKCYGITVQELHATAVHNLRSAIEFKSMRDVLMEILDPIAAIMLPDDGIPMYVLSNKEKLNGAAAILDSGTLADISEKLGGDYLIIPSSIHEVIILPFQKDIGSSEIEKMIRDVNTEHVEPEERLSNHVYQYDSKTHELVRMKERECIR